MPHPDWHRVREELAQIPGHRPVVAANPDANTDCDVRPQLSPDDESSNALLQHIARALADLPS